MTETAQQDVVDVLSTDHAEFLDLIQQIKASTDPTERRDLADTLIAELVRHSVAEEMFVYPAMSDHLPNGKEAVEHDTAEHKELERTMKELEKTDANDPEFLSVVGVLENVLRDHVSDEEGEQFPQLRAHLSREQLVELAGKVETAKKLAPTRPHPLSPNNQLFHKTVGAGVGLVDRLRDKLTGRNQD
ncbi:MAG: hemerythrin domain-containing protein [Actinomycetota bacterium]|jgi:hemerythrin superfamily protein|nr:hemerythrin domain-containing protein [Actinomycetota bacterium]